MIALVAQLLLSAVGIIGAGIVLARTGDVIAARTRLGGLWVGSVFLAVATSLPEIASDVSAVLIGAPDLAAGDLFGSSMANMVILAIVTLMPAGGDLFRKATLDHALYASLAIVLTAIAATAILIRPAPDVLGVGAGSIVLLATYLAGSRVAFRHSAIARRATEQIEMSAAPNGEAAVTGPQPSLTSVAIRFSLAALVLLLVAPLFARSAEGVANATGLGTTFVGTWLVGFSTSLPELVTSLAAVRLRAYDLAVGNLFGSNAFNMAVFPLLDLLNRTGPVLHVINPAHVISALVAMVLMGIALAALVYRGKGRLSLIEPSSALIVLGYVLGLALVLLRSTG
jgi:cation:H+ antiporter